MLSLEIEEYSMCPWKENGCPINKDEQMKQLINRDIREL